MTRLRRTLLFVVSLLATVGLLVTAAGASSSSGATCEQSGRQADNCGSVAADQIAGDFHGLIMVPGQPGVLDKAAHSGTQPGCGDCTWELILACLHNNPNQPDNNADPCLNAVSSGQCHHGDLLFRLYLTTDAVRNDLVDLLCLGGINDVIPVGDQAALDVQRYLKDVTPPPLTLHVAPPNGIPAGLPAYFWVRPPADLLPTPFGNGQITETITIDPQRYNWTWGDATTSGWTKDAGAPYPSGTLTHRYDMAGHYAGHVDTEWGATYTITVAGQTFGPYDAVGTLTKRQAFAVTVLQARSTLVSH